MVFPHVVRPAGGAWCSPNPTHATSFCPSRNIVLLFCLHHRAAPSPQAGHHRGAVSMRTLYTSDPHNLAARVYRMASSKEAIFESPESLNDQKMALAGKMMMYVEINSGGDVLHDIIKNIPNDIASMLPDKIQSCDLVEGEWGTVGSVICWNFTYDGKREVIKQQIEEVTEENHKIVFKVLVVDNIYKSFKIIFHVEPKGDGKLAAVTFEFEKVNPRIPYPTVFMDYLCDVFRGVDDYNRSAGIR
ncbi:hypothetical protein L1987_12056 [Smallanthus sonchifolius]|uniref:Uncharacterized protein n=1 Tax=Smallanthus sonchifolius TaxID=185202 RepID=A0ACB9JF10_9ASTR|nr:hypothetical protein L1987_12056 [Smallanthus sonchifolius]